MANTIFDLYKRHQAVFAFRGNRPGESPNTKINELALIGDSFLYLEVRTKLVMQGLNTSQISNSTSKYLSNFGLTDRAVELGIIPNRQVGTHAAGTLLEAIFGFWWLSSRKRDSKALIYTPYQAAFKSAIASIVSDSMADHASNKMFDDMFLGGDN